MGYIHKLNRIEMRFAILVLQNKIYENSMRDAWKNVILK